MSLITLTTDFGMRDSYVAQMKGVILGIAPQVRIVDVTHLIPPQDVARGAAVLEEIAGAFPKGTIHVAVIDPGVGSARALVAAEAAGQGFLAPDNGLLTFLFRRFPPSRIHRLTMDRYWRRPVSATFHGRDVLAPVAAHWSLGADIADFGPPLDPADVIALPANGPRRIGSTVVGRVESIDAFGNLITNVREDDLPPGDRNSLAISCCGHHLTGIGRCYSDAPRGSVLALIGSLGRLEISVNGGSAAQELHVAPTAEVRIETPG